MKYAEIAGETPGSILNAPVFKSSALILIIIVRHIVRKEGEREPWKIQNGNKSWIHLYLQV